MTEKVYFICDDTCLPLDPYALSIESMTKNAYLERYGNLDWAFDSYDEAIEWCSEEIQ